MIAGRRVSYVFAWLPLVGLPLAGLPLVRLPLAGLLLMGVLLAGCPGPEPTMDASMDAGAPDAGRCVLASECDDGRFCNGAETCEDGVCTAASPPRCDDGIACTVDACSEAARACVSTPPDGDGDGYGGVGCGDGADCDDADPDTFPGNLERCDPEAHDEDCDPSTHGGLDEDGDGFESDACCNGTDCGTDCDDARFTSNTGGNDVCNGLDDDCDGDIDEMVRVDGFVDADRDGWGDSSLPRIACETDVGFSVNGGDCDDTPETGIVRSPGQPEFCDGLDNDCDPNVDEMAAPLDWFVDSDGDGFGSRSSGPVISSCTPISGRVLNARDCDDRSSSFSPRAPELCNGLDDDCNGLSDFLIAPGNFEDDDLDRVLDMACPMGRDCDDRSASVGSGDVEICDGRDNDCDTQIDEDASSAVYFRDIDGDGFGSDRSGALVGCAPPAGYVSRGGDCDDGDAARSPIADEQCDGVDADCDGAIDETATCPLSGTCARGTCRDPSCALGTDECLPGTALDCETDVTRSVEHCGGCGRRCDATGTASAPTCSGGRCSLSCAPSRADCDARADNGCEVDTLANTDHCGGCGLRCNAGTGDAFRCTAGACGVTCRAGFSDCDGNPRNGCETTGTSCPACGPLEADCDFDGRCDDLASLSYACGACGVTCGPGSRCEGGVCDVPVEVDTNNAASCARFSSGSVACWGDNSQGALGQTNTPPFPGAALEVFLFGRAIEVAMANATGCALLDDGSVWCWGSNFRGLLGVDPATLPFQADPLRIELPRPATHVALGRNFGCALHRDGGVTCWGTNVDQALVASGPETRSGPVAISFPVLTGVRFLAVSERAVCIANRTEVSCVGGLPNDVVRANGNGSLLTSSLPIVDLTAGGRSACVRFEDGDVRCWGGNDNGQLGIGTLGGVAGDFTVPSEFGVAADLAVSQWTTCAIDAVGTLRCVGDNQYRMSGDAATSLTSIARATPIAAFEPGTRLSRGSNTSHLCAVEPSGRVFCWGVNAMSQCGLDPSAFVLSPTIVGGL